MMKRIMMAAALGLFAAPVLADIEKVGSDKSVSATMDALVAAVEGAGANVFARVNHGKGATSVGMDLADAELLIFGNPKLGTPAMQADMLAGLYLPLKVLVYEDGDGKVWLAYEEVEETFDDLDIDDDAEFIGKMEGALKNLTAKAAE